ncbi:MAG: mechanosensitive ion channel [Proteobacteria bacterium]|nr:mechanosensitive ion channel [Pseudomonadota bacterium]
MEFDQSVIAAWFGGIWADFLWYVRLLAQPNQLLQLATLAVCVLLAWLLARQIGPRLEVWALSVEGRPKWQLRWIVILRRRLQLGIFALLAWLAVGGFKMLYAFPSRRYVLALVATMALTWFCIRIAAQAVRNQFLRQFAIWGLTIYAALYYAGSLDQAAAFLDGLAVDFGSFHLSVLAILKAAIVTGLLFYAARLLSVTASARISRNEDISPSMRVLTVKFLQITLYFLAGFIGLKSVGFDLSGLTVLSGAIGVGLGFGLQKVVSNLVSGIIILLDKSVKPGDVISLGDTFGWIAALGARYVSVVTRDGREYLIPNEDLITGQVVNWSHSDEFVRIDLFFGVSYDDDPHLVRKIAVKAALSVDRVLKTRPAVCHINGFGDSSVDYILRFWIRDPVEGLTNVRGGVYLALWDAFKEHGVTLPFPQREVRILGDGAARPPNVTVPQP